MNQPDTHERLERIEEELRSIQDRNTRVAADKAWETSLFRIISLLLITYGISAFVLYEIGNQNPLRNAFIPTIGYLLSMQSLPFLKRYWIRNHLSRKNVQ
ncbi:hypothetical protein A3C86_03575 [Candidatus Kaiserbacteria bacterium RIFCSPHIGHO2_02_FULL_49_16]|uniref:2TM domain-containing protein n=1 Tax=Candidatus Kaiserbacteria bacterium RIFCSPHIGHO2_02_FULL_49_16 TaxID=1798490 RepID=A0A1F6DAA1_9BACT|nr:MAG: hypothetical protein A3C86_03575 [Candidatus Kaiserbacteria bacterium RIFCSPHIGHO2_02_FULL_49_16]